MSRNHLVVPLALAAAGLYAVTGAIGLAHDQPAHFSDPLDYVLEWAFVGGLGATVAALAILARSGAGIGAWLATVGNSALLVAATATAVRGQESLDPMFGIGVLAIVAGYIVLTVNDVRGRLVPNGLGLILLIGWFASIPVDVATGAGGFVLGAAWAGVARVSAAPRAVLAS
jgi:hypothetical protein